MLRPSAHFYVAVLLVALNLRTVFASLPPLLDRIRDDLGLSATVGGLLTTGPVLCFGLLAPVVPRHVRRVPIERVIAICAAFTAVGAAARGLGVVGSGSSREPCSQAPPSRSLRPLSRSCCGRASAATRAR